MGESQLDLLERLLHQLERYAGMLADGQPRARARGQCCLDLASIDLDRLYAAMVVDKATLRAFARVAARELA